MPTFSEYLDGWLSKAESFALTNPLVKMPVKRFRVLSAEDDRVLEANRTLDLGTLSEPIVRNLQKNFENHRRERGEHTAYATRGQIELRRSAAAGCAGPAERVALLPVWLRKVALIKANNLIKAKADEGDEWKINPMLARMLQDFGIELQPPGQATPEDVVAWLRVQLGNQGKVEHTAYVGLFSSQQKIIHDRLEMMGPVRSALAQNEVIRARLEGTPLEGGQSQEICDEGIEDLGIALKVDDSQLRVIQLADAGRSLQVEGPPGTGKSETIANIIANALWRGRKVLLVCDKKVAIQQVEDRLTGLKLEPALLNLHQDDLTPRELIKQAARGFGQAAAATGFPIEQLQDARKQLNDRVRFNRKTCHAAAQVENFKALDGLMRLKRELPAVPAIEIERWESLSADRLQRELQVIRQWQPLQPILVDARNIWNALRHENYESDPNAPNTIAACCAAIPRQLEALHELREEAGSLGCETSLNSDAEVEGLIALARAVVARPACYTEILHQSAYHVAEVDELEKIWNECAALGEADHPIDVSAGITEETRAEAASLLTATRARAWSELLEQRDFHAAQIRLLEETERRFQSLRPRLGVSDSTSRARRESALRLVQELASHVMLIPKDWWSLERALLAEIGAWKTQLLACAARLEGEVEPADLSAFQRLTETHFKVLNMRAETGFNAVHYVFRYVDDSRCRFALRQIFPRLQIKGCKVWHELALRALELHSMARKLDEASKLHPLLAQETQQVYASSLEKTFSPPDLFASHAFLSLEAVAEIVEQMRLQNNLFELESPIWRNFWLSAPRQLLEEAGEFLAQLAEIHPVSDDLQETLLHHRAMAARLEKFIADVGLRAGNLTHAVRDTLAAQSRWQQLVARLEPLTKYRALEPPETSEPAWDWLRSTIQWRDDFERRAQAQRLNLESRAWPALLMASEAHEKAMGGYYKSLEKFFSGFGQRFSTYEELQVLMEELRAGLSTQATLWLQKAQWHDRVRAHQEVTDLWQRVLQGEVPVAQAERLFCFNLLFKSQPFVEPRGGQLEQALAQFGQLEENLASWTIDKLRGRLKHAASQARNEFSGSATEISRLAGLQVIRGKPREILNQHRGFLLRAKPCWMMSPISLANLAGDEAFQDGPPFDLVIFDEASQVRVLDGLFSMAFGRQVVIVGDRKQLPPTNFFSATSNQDDDDDTFGVAQSLLEEFSGTLPAAMLMSHYRSETPDLIQFSNQHFYDGKLELYPPARVAGVGRKLHYVSDGVYDAGVSRTNTREAEEVCKLIELHVRENPTLSLGVVTMNAAQMEKVDDLLVERCAENERLREFTNDEERFFVRNLESVQGDEMDRIILSMTYGKNAEGRFGVNYLGPLIKSGGERRLNVAMTRSRSGMTVVTSMRVADLDGTGGTTAGFTCLRDFLADLETSVLAQNYGVRNERFRRRADTVSQVVYCESPFEEQVLEFLENQGYTVECQVGSGKFRIDLVVKDGERNVIAIECDGAAYHSSLIARTRDRGRQRILESRGWRVHRVWSTNWWHFRQQEQAGMLHAIDSAQGG